MADFKTRIDDLTGFGSTDDVAIADWLIAGAREIIDVLPMSKLDRMSEIQEFTSFQGVEDSKILHVLRKDENNSNVLMPCREIHASQSGRASDSNYMEFATSSDPVYYLENKRIYTLPASASTDDSKLVKINEDFTIVATDSTIDNFPKEATNAVVLYASRNALMRLMNSLQSNTLIDDTSTGALALMNAEIDDVVHDTTGSLKLAKDQIGAFVTSIGDIDDTTELFDSTNKRFTVVRDALVKAQDIIDNDGFGADLDVTDFVGDVDTALGKINANLTDEEAILTDDPTNGAISVALEAIKTAVDQAKAAADKFLADDSDSVFGDEDTFLTDNSQLTRVKDALDKAQETITGDAPSSTTSARGAQSQEDVELVTSALNISQTEIARAQAHLAEWTSIGDMRVKEAQIALSEADGYAKEVQARLGYAAAYIAAANARTQEGSSRMAQANLGVAVAQQELQRANIAIAEINSLMASYSLELQSVAPYMSEVSGKLAAAAQYGQEFQARLTRDQAKYQWYTQQYQMVNAQFQEALQLIGIDKLKIEQMSEGR
jgi:hypothetical protein